MREGSKRTQEANLTGCLNAVDPLLAAVEKKLNFLKQLREQGKPLSSHTTNDLLDKTRALHETIRDLEIHNLYQDYSV